MTQSYNLSQLANNLNTAGQLDATDGLVGAVPAANGGTGQAAYTVGDILYASGATALARLPDVATGNVLISGGVATSPSYAKVGLTTHISGTLPIANGGTNATATPTAGAVIYGTGTAYAASAAGTTGQVLTSQGSSAPIWSAAGGQIQATLFTTSTTWTCPANVTKVKAIVIGGGGGGNTGGGTFSGANGGYGLNYYTVVPGTVYTISVGLGGDAANPGNNGGTSSFGSFISSTGGTGATGSANGTPGSCANSLVNSAVVAFTGASSGAIAFATFNDFFGFARSPSSAGGTAKIWTAASGYLPGVGGQTTATGVVSGGYSGVVYLQYVG